jgi:hypothetical protein
MKAIILAGLLAVATAGPAFADIIGLDDSHSWATGSDTIAGLGYVMEDIDLSGLTDFTNYTSFGSPAGTIQTNPDVNKRTVGSSWATWSHGATPDVLFSDGETSMVLTMPGGVTAFDFYLEPDPFDVITLSATTQDGTMVTQDVSGNAGAKYYGFYATDGMVIDSVTISGPTDFAFGEMRISTTAMPEPAAMLLLVIGMAGVGAARRRRNARRA